MWPAVNLSKYPQQNGVAAHKMGFLTWEDTIKNGVLKRRVQTAE